MGTLVSFHAHPDDESISCGGVLRKAYEQGHRVVLVVATRGELGEVVDGVLAEDEDLCQRRERETRDAAGILGVHRVEFLGYIDSGMRGEPANDAPESFWSADVHSAADRLAAILAEENADALTVYDDNGTYGHPDHVQVHRVGLRAARNVGVPRVYQSTVNRDRMRQGMRARKAALGDAPAMRMPPRLGKPESELTAAVDVTAYVDHKRRAIRAHASQISEQSVFLAMPEQAFRFAFGTEWFIRSGQGPGITETDLLTGVA